MTSLLLDINLVKRNSPCIKIYTRLDTALTAESPSRNDDKASSTSKFISTIARTFRLKPFALSLAVRLKTKFAPQGDRHPQVQYSFLTTTENVGRLDLSFALTLGESSLPGQKPDNLSFTKD